MLEKDYMFLSRCIAQVKKGSKNIQGTLDRIIQEPHRSFRVSFAGKNYTFIHPSTLEELAQMRVLRTQLIQAIIKQCYCDMIDQMYLDIDKTWETVFAFTMGDPLEYHQIEKIEHNDVDNLIPDEKKSVALDEENYQVRMALEKERKNKIKKSQKRFVLG